jgi:hypothetical protein
MNKTPKFNPATAPGATKGQFQPLLSGKKAPPLLAQAPKPTKAELAAKSASEAAERDKKLDLVLHRFAKLL